jgi:amphi-Trp domain-containing protein
MSEVTVEHTESLSREQAAVWLHALSEAVRKGGKVTLPLGSAEGTDSTVSLRFPEHMQAEFEVEVDRDEVQVEVELTWSTAQAEAGDGGSDES